MRETLRAQLCALNGEESEFEVRRHPPEEFQLRGEYSSNIALVRAAKIKSTPGAIAGELASKINWLGWRCRAEKGFLNFRMNDDTLRGSISQALAEADGYGCGESLSGRRVNVEFVSADPTGPLHLHHARIAVGGDVLCRLLASQGADVTREYFLNDIENSSRMRLLGESVAAFYLQQFGQDEEPPEGALDDEFVRRLAAQIAAREGNRFLLCPEAERVATFAHEAREAAVAHQKQSLRALNVAFDVWTSESALHRDGRIAATMEQLQTAGHIDERDGVQWLRTSSFGDEADRPLCRANGEYTYLASDIAYHSYRFERDFDLLFNIWTSQHRQYLARTRAALQAAGYKDENLEVLTCADASLTRDGVAVGEGEFAPTLNFALEEVEAKNLRFLLLLAEWHEPAVVEIETARRDDESNPAYAARLLPARLSTLGREAAAKSEAAGEWSEAERQLARFVALWPGEAAAALRERRPQRVARFVLEMSEATQQLQSTSRPPQSTPADLLRAARITAGNALRILGIEATDRF